MASFTIFDLIKFFDEKHKNNPFIVVLKNIAPFPLLMYVGLPILVFASLFYIPENYAGIFPFSQSMSGTYQNKWLFDMFGIYNIVFIIVCILKYFSVGMPNQVEVALLNYMKTKNPEIFTIQRINIIILISIFLLIFWACNFTFFQDMPESSRERGFRMSYSTWQRDVFANFFICSIKVCVPQILLTCLTIYSFELRRVVKHNQIQ